MMNEESTARADGAEQVEVSPAPESTTNANDVNAGSMVKTKGGCCSSTKKFFLYDSSRPEIQAFYFNQVRVSSGQIMLLSICDCVVMLDHVCVGINTHQKAKPQSTSISIMIGIAKIGKLHVLFCDTSTLIQLINFSVILHLRTCSSADRSSSSPSCSSVWPSWSWPISRRAVPRTRTVHMKIAATRCTVSSHLPC